MLRWQLHLFSSIKILKLLTHLFHIRIITTPLIPLLDNQIYTTIISIISILETLPNLLLVHSSVIHEVQFCIFEGSVIQLNFSANLI